jgi:hypothetical protein
MDIFHFFFVMQIFYSQTSIIYLKIISSLIFVGITEYECPFFQKVIYDFDDSIVHIFTIVVISFPKL